MVRIFGRSKYRPALVGKVRASGPRSISSHPQVDSDPGLRRAQRKILKIGLAQRDAEVRKGYGQATSSRLACNVLLESSLIKQQLNCLRKYSTMNNNAMQRHISQDQPQVSSEPATEIKRDCL